MRRLWVAAWRRELRRAAGALEAKVYVQDVPRPGESSPSWWRRRQAMRRSARILRAQARSW